MTIGLGIFDIDFLMGYIHVSAHDDRFAVVQFVEIGLKVFFPCHTIVQTAQLILRIWCIYGDKKKCIILKRDDAAFVIVFIDTNAVGHMKWFMSGIDSGTRIPLFISIIPV